MLGYGNEELRSMTWMNITYPDDAELGMYYFERLVVGDLDYNQYEKRYVR